MKAESARRKERGEVEVIDLLSSSDEDEELEVAKKPSATNRRRKHKATINLQSESGYDNDLTSPGRRPRSSAVRSHKVKPSATLESSSLHGSRNRRCEATLHNEGTKERHERKRKEFDHRTDSKTDRAGEMVKQVIQLLQTHATKGIEPVGKDDAVPLVVKMMELQEKFEKEGRPTHVCVCYHYTDSINMDSIRTDGLLTVEDRKTSKNTNTRNTARFVSGIYCGKH